MCCTCVHVYVHVLRVYLHVCMCYMCVHVCVFVYACVYMLINKRQNIISGINLLQLSLKVNFKSLINI